MNKIDEMSSGPSVISILDRFKKAYMQFIDELINQFPNETDLIKLRVFCEDQIPVSVIADGFVEYVLPYKEMIQKRDVNFFLDKGNTACSGSSNGKSLYFFLKIKNIWQSNQLDQDDREAIWKWFDTFCKLAEAYRKTK